MGKLWGGATIGFDDRVYYTTLSTSHFVIIERWPIGYSTRECRKSPKKTICLTFERVIFFVHFFVLLCFKSLNQKSSGAKSQTDCYMSNSLNF